MIQEIPQLVPEQEPDVNNQHEQVVPEQQPQLNNQHLQCQKCSGILSSGIRRPKGRRLSLPGFGKISTVKVTQKASLSKYLQVGYLFLTQCCSQQITLSGLKSS